VEEKTNNIITVEEKTNNTTTHQEKRDYNSGRETTTVEENRDYNSGREDRLQHTTSHRYEAEHTGIEQSTRGAHE
jgi:hypothetical protein